MNYFRATTLKSPFGWVGGKSRLAKQIVEMMERRINFMWRYLVEGYLCFMLNQKIQKSVKWRKDINGELVNLHRVIKTFPASFSYALSELLISREMFFNFKNHTIKPRNKIERAVFFYYRLIYSFASKGDNFAFAKEQTSKEAL